MARKAKIKKMDIAPASGIVFNLDFINFFCTNQNTRVAIIEKKKKLICLLYTSPSPRD